MTLHQIRNNLNNLQSCVCIGRRRDGVGDAARRLAWIRVERGPRVLTDKIQDRLVLLVIEKHLDRRNQQLFGMGIEIVLVALFDLQVFVVGFVRVVVLGRWLVACG